MKTLLYIVGISLFSSCVIIKNLPEEDVPVWIDNSKRSDTLGKDHVKFVSYNIQLAEDIPGAISEFQTYPDLTNPDIVFLQEMDSLGINELAKQLDMNSVFIPAVKYGKELEYYGNGILTSCEIIHAEKIILPHISKSRRQRIAVYANVIMGGSTVHLYNLHLATMTMTRRKRLEQMHHVIDHAAGLNTEDPIIIAGDLNTFFKEDRNQFTALMAKHGYTWQTADVKCTNTALKGLIKKPVDHIFTKGVTIDNVGAQNDAVASDHYPLFATLRM